EGSLLGSSNVIIELGDATTNLKDGDVIQTKEEAGLLGNLTSEAKPLISKVRNAADTATLLLSNFNNILNPATQHELQATIANLSRSTAALNALLNSLNQPLSATMENMNAITSNIKNQNKAIEGILNNANTFTNDLKQLQLQRTIDSLNATI